eukprot:1145346-Pelagomonas_calceolata.AAC.7
MDTILTNTLQVVHVNLGSGMYSSSKLLSMRHVIQGCQNLVSPTAFLSASRRSACTTWLRRALKKGRGDEEGYKQYPLPDLGDEN